MPSYLSPGVYVEEVPAATRPIEGVGTAIAGFVGFASAGPTNEPTLVTNWQQFVDTFGDINIIVNGFYAMKAHWSEHPDRDEAWADQERSRIGDERFRREHECEFFNW